MRPATHATAKTRVPTTSTSRCPIRPPGRRPLAEWPEAQREVFVAHELEGLSFKEMAARSGVAQNTLLARKRYAVLHLRDRLQAVYDDFDF